MPTVEKEPWSVRLLKVFGFKREANNMPDNLGNNHKPSRVESIVGAYHSTQKSASDGEVSTRKPGPSLPRPLPPKESEQARDSLDSQVGDATATHDARKLGAEKTEQAPFLRRIISKEEIEKIDFSADAQKIGEESKSRLDHLAPTAVKTETKTETQRAEQRISNTQPSMESPAAQNKTAAGSELPGRNEVTSPRDSQVQVAQLVSSVLRQKAEATLLTLEVGKALLLSNANGRTAGSRRAADPNTQQCVRQLNQQLSLQTRRRRSRSL